MFKKVFAHSLLCLSGSLLLAQHQAHEQSYGDHVIDHTAMHNQTMMHGMYGMYPMSRDGTGTAWDSDSSRKPAIRFMQNGWSIMLHGYANATYDHQSGPRGAQKFFSENFFMPMAQKDYGKSTFGLRGMFTLEPGTIGSCGYPLLLQTGETCNGITPLIDRQHPHNFFMELAAIYTYRFTDQKSLFFYFGLPGEPAIGPVIYMHRFSAMYNPETPITHHWLDSTHITFGVFTAGFIWNKNFKIDASIFTGREPDQHRWGFNKPRFDSYCARISCNPTEDLALQISAGFLKSPEQLHPNVNTVRVTSSAMYTTNWDKATWATTWAFGCNIDSPGHILPGMLLESTAEICEKHIVFGRFEYVAKDDLFIEPDPRANKVYNIAKLDAGYIYEFDLIKDTKWGIGGVGSIPLLPESIDAVYGGTPFSYMIFLRVELRQ